MNSQLFAWGLIKARCPNHLRSGAAYASLIRKTGGKMLPDEENQILRIVQITQLKRSIGLLRRQILVVRGVALHCLLSQKFSAYTQ